MKLKLILAFLLLSALFCNAQNNYNWYALPDAPKSFRLDDFFFLTPKLGWATFPGYYGYYPTQFGQIFKTIDGGNSWQLLKDSSFTYYRSIGFADSLTGWVGNLGYTGVDPDLNILYQTNDGGITWNPANVPYPHPPGICGISVVTDLVIYAYGTFYGPPGYLKTMDKGATWVYKDMSTYAGAMVDGYFFSPDTGFITGNGPDKKAMILYTDDGGTTWQVRYHSTHIGTENVWKLSFPSRNTAYASVENESPDSTTADYFLKTTDGGTTWIEYPFISKYDEEGIGFINDSVGWIGGDYQQPNFKTTDGGNTWTPDYSFGVLTPSFELSDGGFVINRFRRFGDTLMYASGNTMYKLNTNAAIATGISQLQKEAPVMYNYPNPFNMQTTISYYIPCVSINVILDVYNVLGQKVYDREMGAQNMGNHKFIFDVPLPSGMYYFTISTDKFNLKNTMEINHQ